MHSQKLSANVRRGCVTKWEIGNRGVTVGSSGRDLGNRVPRRLYQVLYRVPLWSIRYEPGRPMEALIPACESKNAAAAYTEPFESVMDW